MTNLSIVQATRFEANHAEAVDQALANLSQEEKDSLLRLFAAQESIKKEGEINKNYKDIRSYNSARFAMQLEDRLRSKIWSSNKVTNVLGGESVAAVSQIDTSVEATEIKKAAKSGKKNDKQETEE